MYGCETWSLTLREERRLREFENMVLWKILGHKKGKVTGEWRKLHIKELYEIYSSTNIIRRMRWVRRVARRGEKRGIYTVLVGKPGGKRSLGRPWSRWEDNTACLKRDDPISNNYI